MKQAHAVTYIILVGSWPCNVHARSFCWSATLSCSSLTLQFPRILPHTVADPVWLTDRELASFHLR